MSKFPINDLISPRKVAEYLDVTIRTVKRWEQKYNWSVLKINDRFLRYRKSEVENSLSVEIPTPAE